jgi:hypothetical protein
LIALRRSFLALGCNFFSYKSVSWYRAITLQQGRRKRRRRREEQQEDKQINAISILTTALDKFTPT